MTPVSFRRCVRVALLAACGALACTASAYELVVNGSFEANGGVGSGTFTGWSSFGQPGSQGGFKVQTGTTPPLTPFAVPAPPGGNFAAMSDQLGPGGHTLHQDVTIPPGAAAALTARVFVLNQAEEFFAPADLDYNLSPNQQARFDIVTTVAAPQDIGAGVLQNLFRTQAGDAVMGGYLTISADLSAYAGQTIRLRFAETDNRQGLNFGIDMVSVTVPGQLGSTTSVASAPNPSIMGQMATFTATVAVPSAVPVTGTVAFFADNIPIAGCAAVVPVNNAAQCSTAALAPGAHGIRADFVGDSNYTASTGAATHSVTAPPSIAKAFGAPAIPLNATTSLTFIITNPAVNTVALTGVAFVDALPAGLAIATPNALANTCGGMLVAAEGTGSIGLTGGTVAASSSCSVTVNVIGLVSGHYTNTTGSVSATNGGTGNAATANLTVASSAAIAKGFNSPSQMLGGSTTLTFTIHNPNANVALTAIGFTDTLPAGMVVATPSGAANTCGGATSANAGAASVSLSGGALAAGASCTVSVNVTSTTAGAKENNVLVTSEVGPGNTSTATLTVIGPPAISKAFGAASIPLDGVTTLSFTIQNTNGTASLTGIGFIDTLPAGLAIPQPNGQIGTCGGGAITAAAGGNTVTLSGATLAQSASCTFSVNVMGISPGIKDNTTGNVASNEGGTGGTASASLTVLVRPPIPTLSGWALALLAAALSFATLRTMRKRWA